MFNGKLWNKMSNKTKMKAIKTSK